jgi:hypothetical protein
MPRSPQELLTLAEQFEKFAVDIKQPPEFEEDFQKWLENKDMAGPATSPGFRIKQLLPPADPSSGDLPSIPELPSLPEFSPEDDADYEVIKDDDYETVPEGEYELISDTDKKTASSKEKKKLDPKAKVRNRGTVCVPASQAKDKKDHFLINDEGQARNALARVHQYSSVPAWYNGSLKGLQALVSRKVHSKYPSIGKDKSSKKKSALQVLLSKYGSPDAFARVINDYDTGSVMVRDFAQGMKQSAELFAREADLDNPGERKIYDVLLRQAALVEGIIPEMEVLDREMHDDPGFSASNYSSTEEEPPTE